MSVNEQNQDEESATCGQRCAGKCVDANHTCPSIHTWSNSPNQWYVHSSQCGPRWGSMSHGLRKGLSPARRFVVTLYSNPDPESTVSHTCGMYSTKENRPMPMLTGCSVVAASCTAVAMLCASCCWSSGEDRIRGNKCETTQLIILRVLTRNQ